MNHTLLMELVSDLGSKMAANGAETYRVEESINRIVAAYGLDSRVYSVPNSLIITIMLPDGTPMTQLCRMDKRSIDLDAVERYSNLGRRICGEVPEPALAMQWLEETEQTYKKYSFPAMLLGNVLVSWGFCIFFGGTLADSFGAVACGLLVAISEYFMGKVNMNTFFQKIAAAFLMALAAYGFCSFGLVRNADATVIGALMLLVPGIMFTNAIRDIIFGDTNSGVNRIVETLLVAVAIAAGTAVAWNASTSLWGVSIQAPIVSHGPLVTCTVSFVACTGFMIVFNIHGRGKLLCALGGTLTWAAYCLAQALGYDSLLCCFIATCVASVFSEAMARIRKYPAISYLIISLVPLIPGAGTYYTAQQATQGNISAAVSHGGNALATAGVMAAGILVISTAVRVWTSSKQKHSALPVK